VTRPPIEVCVTTGMASFAVSATVASATTAAGGPKTSKQQARSAVLAGAGSRSAAPTAARGSGGHNHNAPRHVLTRANPSAVSEVAGDTAIDAATAAQAAEWLQLDTQPATRAEIMALVAEVGRCRLTRLVTSVLSHVCHPAMRCSGENLSCHGSVSLSLCGSIASYRTCHRFRSKLTSFGRFH
jgi:hypothetical protein